MKDRWRDNLYRVELECGTYIFEDKEQYLLLLALGEMGIETHLNLGDGVFILDIEDNTKASLVKGIAI